MLLSLSELYHMSMNELVLGERIALEALPAKAEEALTAVMRQPPFLLWERQAYWEHKWNREHRDLFVISDPMGHPEDTECVIDRVMALKQDGLVAIRTAEELDGAFSRCGLIRREMRTTRMRFSFPPRPEYDTLLKQLPPEQQALYALARNEKCVRVGDIAVGNLLYVQEG